MNLERVLTHTDEPSLRGAVRNQLANFCSFSGERRLRRSWANILLLSSDKIGFIGGETNNGLCPPMKDRHTGATVHPADPVWRQAASRNPKHTKTGLSLIETAPFFISFAFDALFFRIFLIQQFICEIAQFFGHF